MESTKLSALLLILTIFISTTPPILSCGYCPPSTKNPNPPKSKPQKYHPAKTTNPPKGGAIVFPPIIGKPPGTVPPVIGKPPIIIGKPPVVGPPSPGNAPCPPGSTPGTPGMPGIPGTPGTPGTPATPTPPAGPATCPIDTLKLAACVDLLGGLVHIGLGDPVVNQCCPLLQGLLEIEAAVCLCTTIRLRLLNINLYLSLALQLLVTCGITPPPGYTCAI